MAAVLIRPSASEKSRLRLFVVQAMVLALFVTLFGRLWYIQVLTGDSYRAQAADVPASIFYHLVCALTQYLDCTEKADGGR